MLAPSFIRKYCRAFRDDKIFEQVKFILQQYRMTDIHLMDATNYAINLYRHLRRKGGGYFKIRLHADFKYQVLHGQNLTTIFYAAVKPRRYASGFVGEEIYFTGVASPRPPIHGWQTIFKSGGRGCCGGRAPAWWGYADNRASEGRGKFT